MGPTEGLLQSKPGLFYPSHQSSEQAHSHLPQPQPKNTEKVRDFTSSRKAIAREEKWDSAVWTAFIWELGKLWVCLILFLILPQISWMMLSIIPLIWKVLIASHPMQYSVCSITSLCTSMGGRGIHFNSFLCQRSSESCPTCQAAF